MAEDLDSRLLRAYGHGHSASGWDAKLPRVKSHRHHHAHLSIDTTVKAAIGLGLTIAFLSLGSCALYNEYQKSHSHDYDPTEDYILQRR